MGLDPERLATGRIGAAETFLRAQTEVRPDQREINAVLILDRLPIGRL